MSKDWVQDMSDLHKKFGVKEIVQKFDQKKLHQFLKFRLQCLDEELDEAWHALDNDETAPEEIVDAIIDLCVFAVGTLDLFEVDGHIAWDEVYRANITKELGIKEGRPNPYGLPDLRKPEGWQAPSHEENHGLLPKAFSDVQ